jgi:hypothetical protein
MKAFITLALILCLILSIVFCSDKSTTSSDRASSRTEQLLGLAQSHANLYQQFDSLVTYSPAYHIEVDTSLVTLLIEDTDQSQTRYDIGFPSEKLARLIITTNSVAMTGYYQKIDGRDSLFYFINIPEILPSRLVKEDTWTFYVPPLHRDSKEIITSTLNYGFGYEVTRTYLGTEEIVVPAGDYLAYVIKSDYRLKGSDEIVKTDTEYLASGVGLVRMDSAGKFGSSHIFLIQTDPLETQR